MKKLVLMACVMSAMFFASCGGSKMYQDAEKIVKEGQAAIEKAKDCEEATKASVDCAEKLLKLDPKSYNGDTITADEAKKLEELSKEMAKKLEEKCKK